MSTDEKSSPPFAGRAGRREWIGLAVIAVPALLDGPDGLEPRCAAVEQGSRTK